MNRLYASSEWKWMHGIDRAQLLLVIEGLKKGTIIEGNWTHLPAILDKTGLKYNLNSSKYQLKPVFVIAREEAFVEKHKRLINLPKKVKSAEYHRIHGAFLSYPECCTEEYVRPRTHEERLARRKKQHDLSYTFGRELIDLIKKTGSYPDEFNYMPPSYTPCSINCPEAATLLKTWKEAITVLDSDAGKELAYFHMYQYPGKLAHKEYVAEENKRRSLEYKILKLRRSIL